MEFEGNETVNPSDVMEKVRSCPICPGCGSKKFDRLQSKDTVVKCVKCGKQIKI